MIRLSCALSLLVVLAGCALGDDPRVVLDQGSLKGTTLTSRGGRNIYSFKSIPFAAPPIGDLKYKVRKY